MMYPSGSDNGGTTATLYPYDIDNGRQMTKANNLAYCHNENDYYGSLANPVNYCETWWNATDETDLKCRDNLRFDVVLDAWVLGKRDLQLCSMTILLMNTLLLLKLLYSNLKLNPLVLSFYWKMAG